MLWDMLHKPKLRIHLIYWAEASVLSPISSYYQIFKLLRTDFLPAIIMGAKLSKVLLKRGKETPLQGQELPSLEHEGRRRFWDTWNRSNGRWAIVISTKGVSYRSPPTDTPCHPETWSEILATIKEWVNNVSEMHHFMTARLPGQKQWIDDKLSILFSVDCLSDIWMARWHDRHCRYPWYSSRKGVFAG